MFSNIREEEGCRPGMRKEYTYMKNGGTAITNTKAITAEGADTGITDNMRKIMRSTEFLVLLLFNTISFTPDNTVGICIDDFTLN
ncbi:hypothetical protein ASE55_01905 [Chryseobacterium sp. Leaf201]|nr:hypothetical protein ASE55_01905 [Chryseobacterium sp. Leaf201]